MINAIYAMPAGGVLSISVEDAVGSPDGIVLAVQDDGAGIAEADLPRVFEAFFTTRSTVGTGIRLFVAKQFVEGHGGSIEIEAVRLGKITVRPFAPFCHYPRRMSPRAIVRRKRIEWTMKCGRSFHSYLQHACSGI